MGRRLKFARNFIQSWEWSLKSRSERKFDFRAARGVQNFVMEFWCGRVMESRNLRPVSESNARSGNPPTLMLYPYRFSSWRRKRAGQVLGAFHDAELVGFTMAIAGWRKREPFLHSHMTAVLDQYRDHGIGRRLKLLSTRRSPCPRNCFDRVDFRSH